MLAVDTRCEWALIHTTKSRIVEQIVVIGQNLIKESHPFQTVIIDGIFTVMVRKVWTRGKQHPYSIVVMTVKILQNLGVNRINCVFVEQRSRLWSHWYHLFAMGFKARLDSSLSSGGSTYKILRCVPPHNRTQFFQFYISFRQIAPA